MNKVSGGACEVIDYLRLETNLGNCIDAGWRKKDGKKFAFPEGRVRGFAGRVGYDPQSSIRDDRKNPYWMHLTQLQV